MGEPMPVEKKITMIYTLLWIDLAAYTGLLFFGVKNTIRYVIRMGKWEHFFMVMFYFFSISVAISRILYFVCDYMSSIDWKGDEMAAKVYRIASFTAFYSKAVLGVFQIGTMNELSIKMKHSAEMIAEEQTNKNMLIN